MSENETKSVSPDATGKCGELVTVGEVSTVRESIAAFAGHMLSRQLKPGDLLCLRSQAEKLLAAEIRRERDLAEKQLSEVVDRMSDDYLALKADNAAKDAELKAAKEYGDKWFKYYSDLREPFELNEIERRKLETDNAALTARVKELEKLCNDTEAEALGYASDKADLEAKLAAAEKALGEKPS